MTTDERLVRIEDKADSLLDKVNNLREMVAASTSLHNSCREQQREHHQTLYGPDGIKPRVASLEHSRWYSRVAFGGLWAIVLAAIAVLFAWIAQVPSLMP